MFRTVNYYSIVQDSDGIQDSIVQIENKVDALEAQMLKHVDTMGNQLADRVMKLANKIANLSIKVADQEHIIQDNLIVPQLEIPTSTGALLKASGLFSELNSPTEVTDSININPKLKDRW